LAGFSLKQIMKKGLKRIQNWFQSKNWEIYPFQQQCWENMAGGKSGLLNAPTGSGKTYALWLGCLLPYLGEKAPKKGLKVIWITPLRALAGDIRVAMQQACIELGLNWEIAMRTGDTSSQEKQKQKKYQPDALVTTPESLHIMLSQKDASRWFQNLEVFIVDEWHELLGSKRGVQIELALSRIRGFCSSDENPLLVWGISATIGNLTQALEVLLGEAAASACMVKSSIPKKIEIQSILPEEVEKYPWAGHLGIKMIDKVLPIIEAGTSTLMFTNTRAQTEIWYQQIMEKAPHLAGLVAMHHGSLDQSIRSWVEENLHLGKLKLVVCTGSLDLGVDFRPVETVIQVGGPKGVARFIQRAGRSGHRPGVQSKIYFLPTHSLELIEASALREAVEQNIIEDRKPLELCYDVLMQYLMTLAVGEGFYPDEVYQEIKKTNCYRHLTTPDWSKVMEFLISGGESLSSYEEYARLETDENGRMVVSNKRLALRHRLSIGTIVGDPVLKIKYLSGGFIGTVEESFISLIKPGDVFWFAGRSLEFVQVKDMHVLVRKSKATKGAVPRWMGGRIPLSSLLSKLILEKLMQAGNGEFNDPEMQKIAPLLNRQHQLSSLPNPENLLIEKMKSREGHHVFIYPFEGRYVHEILASILAYRIAQSQPITFSIAMNDYGFELLSDIPIPIEDALEEDLFSLKYLEDDLIHTLNQTDMARRRFRDIASIAGLIFKGFPGRSISFKHLQASGGLIFDVFREYEPDHLLLKQALHEALHLQIDKDRLVESLARINRQTISLKSIPQPSPLAFPIMVDRLREKLSSESIEGRVARMQAEYTA
jgi:ATP-dependent Lhr-like helicase